ncbi:TPA: hypothetical protein ACSP31_003871 [Aeromonas veronii]
MTSALDWKVIITIVVAIIAWLVSFFISVVTFKKNDISRQKDKIITLVEKFIEDLIKEFEKSDNTSDDIDNFISYKVSLIEIQINSIEKRTKKEILGSSLLTKLRSSPIDIFEQSRSVSGEKAMSHNACREVYDLSTQIITDIEKNYNEWFFYDYFKYINDKYFFRLWNLLDKNYDALFKWLFISTLFYVLGWASSEACRLSNVMPTLSVEKKRSFIHSLDDFQNGYVDNVRFSEGFVVKHGDDLKVYGNFNNSCMIYLYSRAIFDKKDFLENQSKAQLIGFGNNGLITVKHFLKNSGSVVVYCNGALNRLSSS